MPSSTYFALAITVIAACLTVQSNGFVPGTSLQRYSIATVTLQAAPEPSAEGLTSRRNAIFGILGTVGAVLAGGPGEATASYSAYTHREQDWEERTKDGKVNYKKASELRAELRAIVPANSEGSKIFCPNGPSSAVSPLMENRCGDRMATPSVYGRTQDVVGNSIPGFATATADTGGFPSYK